MALLYESKFRIQPSKQLGIQKKTRAETLGLILILKFPYPESYETQE